MSECVSMYKAKKDGLDFDTDAYYNDHTEYRYYSPFVNNMFYNDGNVIIIIFKQNTFFK